MKNLQSSLSWLLKGWICFSLFWHLKVALIFIFKRRRMETEKQPLWFLCCWHLFGTAFVAGVMGLYHSLNCYGCWLSSSCCHLHALLLTWFCLWNHVEKKDKQGYVRGWPWWSFEISQDVVDIPGKIQADAYKYSCCFMSIKKKVPLFFPFFPLSVNTHLSHHIKEVPLPFFPSVS